MISKFIIYQNLIGLFIFNLKLNLSKYKFAKLLEKMRIFIKTLQGTKMEMDLDPDMTVTLLYKLLTYID